MFLRELIIKLGLSALMVTHDQNEAMAISDRILLLNNGVIEQQGTPQEMYGSPATLFAAEFMGSNNRLHGKVMEKVGAGVGFASITTIGIMFGQNLHPDQDLVFSDLYRITSVTVALLATLTMVFLVHRVLNCFAATRFVITE